MKVLKRNVSKDEFKKFMDNINLDDKNLYEELSNSQNFIFQFSGNTGSRMTKELKPVDFFDVVNLNAMSRPGSSYNFGNYTLIKDHGQNSPYPEQIQKFLSKSRGLINFQEEIMQIVEYLSPKEDGKPVYSGNMARGLLKRLGKAKKKQEDLDTWNKMVSDLKNNAPSLNITNKDIELLCDDLLTLSSYTFNLSHAAAYSYLAMETVYLAKYFKSYFYAVNLANEAGKTDTIKEAIKSCKESGFKVMPPDINNSRQHFFPSQNNLYFGLEDIKGVGEEPAKVIVENQSYISFIDCVCKNITNSKVNKRVYSALIGGGAFDSIEGENRKYLMDKFLDFWDRKKTCKTVPLLMEKWEDTIRTVIEEPLDKKYLMEYEKDYLGDCFFHNRFMVVDDKIEKLYSKGYCLRDFQEIRSKNLPKQYCFVYVNKYRYHVDKNGNDMMFLEIEDRNGEKASVPIFASHYMHIKSKFYGEGFYLMDLYNTPDDKIMFGSRNYVKSPQTIANMIARVPGV